MSHPHSISGRLHLAIFLSSNIVDIIGGRSKVVGITLDNLRSVVVNQILLLCYW